ncbi:hypothetical protein SANA_07760 [Gottschalkiaceae bacterium SANA]|nr:hypothetical protein SANA_07760 [Gottschalkiaceae bacterium SANA]
MMKRRIAVIGVFFALVFSNFGFATNQVGDLPLQGNQERLFVVKNIETLPLCVIGNFDYDLEKEEVTLQFGNEQIFLQSNLSPDGTEMIDLDHVMVNEEENIRKVFLVFQKIDSPESRRISISADQFYKQKNILTTDEYIILSYWTTDGKVCVERYTYEGVLKGRVKVNERISVIIEGPNGSSLYLQKVNLNSNSMPDEMRCDDPVELIQINWDGKLELAGPKRVIQEQTRVGHTLARFTDNQFGLLRMEEPETGIVDYKAPIRSKENLVKLQIPYCDIKAKLESGARNLMVEYQGLTLSFPMELFQCDDMLAAMPCQDHATIEIIMHTDEAGKVTNEIQLFVVEQTNAMTKIVHRKTLQ